MVSPERIARPITTAMGIVAAMVKRPHGLSASALTTTSASTASRMIMMAMMLMSAMNPANGPTSSATIWPSDLPRRRTEQNMITQSCTAPPSVAPTRIHNIPGRKPNCAASTGPTSGPGPAIAAKWWPNTTHRFVFTKSRPSSCTTAGVARSSSSVSTLAISHAE